jgi:hypothetical protein
MSQDANGDITPDYLKMILLSRVYSPPLNMKETPLTKAVNLSAKLGNEIWLKREELQDVFSFKIRGAYNFMSSLDPEERWKGVVTCSAGASPTSERSTAHRPKQLFLTTSAAPSLRQPRAGRRPRRLQTRHPVHDCHAGRDADNQVAQRRASRGQDCPSRRRL